MVDDEGWRHCASPEVLLWGGCAVILQLHRMQCSGVPLLPGLGFGSIIVFLKVDRFGLSLRISSYVASFFRATRMENITSSIYDVISKGKVALAFSYYK